MTLRECLLGFLWLVMLLLIGVFVYFDSLAYNAAVEAL